MALGHGQHVPDAAALQVAAQVPVTAVEFVRGGPRGWRAGIQHAGEYPPARAIFVANLTSSATAGRGASDRLVSPAPRQVDLPVDRLY
ncbi:MAG TPA: hypothetical protein VFG86_15010, partial [Chloroflexota bacterium]|nr:hypothetical protein [Chloroflexota bacterium]